MDSFVIRRLELADVLLIQPRRFGDHRGYFTETYRASALAEFGITAPFVQDNQSGSAEPGTIRGLHFQRAPAAQAKLVRVIRGAIFDVAVDLRRGSPDFGRWVGATLTAGGGEQLYIPAGFAHGFCTLEPNTEVAYKCDAYYAPDAEGGIRFNDPTIAIAWPEQAARPIVSAKDAALPTLVALGEGFGL